MTLLAGFTETAGGLAPSPWVLPHDPVRGLKVWYDDATEQLVVGADAAGEGLGACALDPTGMACDADLWFAPEVELIVTGAGKPPRRVRRPVACGKSGGCASGTGTYAGWISHRGVVDLSQATLVAAGVIPAGASPLDHIAAVLARYCEASAGTCVNDETLELVQVFEPWQTIETNGGPPPGALLLSDFGAVQNGTTDDTAAVQSAFNALGTGDTLVFDGPGMAAIGSAGVLADFNGRTDITIMGLGRGTGMKALAQSVLADSQWGTFMCEFRNCTRLTVRDMDFNVDSHDHGAFIWYGATDCLFENNYVKHKPNAGTASQAAVGVRWMSEKASFGGVNLTYRHNHILGGPSSGLNQRNLFVAETDGVLIEYNIFDAGGHTNVAVNYSAPLTYRYNASRNSAFDGGKFSQVDRAPPPGGWALTDIHDNVHANNTNAGIHLNGITNVDCSNNSCGNGWYGIVLTREIEDAIIDLNKLCGSNPGPNLEDLSTSLINVTIENNQDLGNCSTVPLDAPQYAGNYIPGSPPPT